MVMHFFQAGSDHETLPGTEEPMTTIDFITALFCRVDDHLAGFPKPGALVKRGVLCPTAKNGMKS